MKTNLPGTVKCAKTETILLHSHLVGAGAAALTVAEPFNFGSMITGITRTGLGTFDFTFTDSFPQLLAAAPFVRGATAGLQARFSALDVFAKTGTLVTETFANGTAAAWQTGVVVAAHTADLPAAGIVTDVVATTETGLFPAWTTGVVVAANAATLTVAGEVIAVNATTATTGGMKRIRSTGTPNPEEMAAWSGATAVAANTTAEQTTAGYITAVTIVAGGVTGPCNLRYDAADTSKDCRVVYSAAGLPTLSFLAADAVTSVRYQQSLRPGLATGEVTVTYSATGVATLTFAAADAVTACAVLVKRKGELQAVKEIVHTGTPGAGQVKVTYAAGIPTLLFNTADNVTACAVAQFPGDATASAVDPADGTDFIDILLLVRNSGQSG